MKRLFLLDGMALIYRAHFALIHAPIRNSKGVNTSAIYGFTNTLLAIMEKEQPTHLGVAFDTSAPTPRHIKFPAYKAQRDAMPEELSAAIDPIKRICRAFQIPILEIDGFEADDIIGTFVKRAEAEDFHSFMVTPDKDFAQLLSPKTSIWRPGRKGSDHEIITPAQLIDIWGVSEPQQIIDLLGLMGDASDNIPGIPGVGPKTAQKFISQFGSIENLIANSSALNPRQRELIQTHAEAALLSKDLATIITDVPMTRSWQDLEIQPPNAESLKEIFAEFELRSLAKRVLGDSPPSSNTPTNESPSVAPTLQTLHQIPHRYQLADTPALQTELLQALSQQPSFCFDLETTSLDRFTADILGIAFSWQAHEAWFLPWSDDLRPAIQTLFLSPSEKIGHNLKFDLSILHHHQIEVAGPFFDTMLADALVHPERRHSMDYLAEVVLGYQTIKLTDLLQAAPSPATEQDLFSYAETSAASKNLQMRDIPLAQLAEYAAEDADITLQLAQILRSELASAQQAHILHDIESPLLPVLVDMEMTGITIDPHALQEINHHLQTHISNLATTIQTHAQAPFNIASPKQLGEVLFQQLQLDPKAKKTKSGQYKTDEATLSALEGKHPIIADILAWREASKLKSTYVDALPSHIVPSTGRIHTHFHQLVAATGRLASSDPNLQNIPVRSEAGKKIRTAFIPPANHTLLSCDYSQIELRIMAAIANDASMIAAFAHGEDIHTTTAAKVFSCPPEDVTSDMRRTAKMVNFGIIYGISAFGLSQRLSIPRSEAAAIIDAYFREYPAIKHFMDATIESARSHGYVETLTGRRRYLPDLNSSNQNIRSNAERAAINTPIQGSAADMIKLAMIHIHPSLRGTQTKMLLQVHDELIFDLHHDDQETLIPQILHLMKTALPLPNGVPIEVEAGTGANWLAAH